MSEQSKPASALPFHALDDLSQDTAGMWWWACVCGVTCGDAVLTPTAAAEDYAQHVLDGPTGNAHSPLRSNDVEDSL